MLDSKPPAEFPEKALPARSPGQPEQLPEAALGHPDSWQLDQSPLTLAASMGLYDVVDRILKVYPQSAMYVNPKGRNVLQVAIKGHQERL